MYVKYNVCVYIRHCRHFYYNILLLILLCSYCTLDYLTPHDYTSLYFIIVVPADNRNELKSLSIVSTEQYYTVTVLGTVSATSPVGSI